MTDADPTRHPEFLLAWVLRYAKPAWPASDLGPGWSTGAKIAHGAIKFSITLIELEPLQGKSRRGSRGASATHDAS